MRSAFGGDLRPPPAAALSGQMLFPEYLRQSKDRRCCGFASSILRALSRYVESPSTRLIAATKFAEDASRRHDNAHFLVRYPRCHTGLIIGYG
jgi:hypothetical protein